jgi:hypothetical protein
VTKRAVAQSRFWSKVNQTEDCWLWTAGKNNQGYGHFGATPAHRVAYEWLVGPIPKGAHLDHLCRVKECVNPSHLQPVSCRENIMRGTGVAAVNAQKTHCPEGHKFAGDNLRVVGSTGERRCLTCYRKYQREWRRQWRRKQGMPFRGNRTKE